MNRNTVAKDSLFFFFLLHVNSSAFSCTISSFPPREMNVSDFEATVIMYLTYLGITFCFTDVDVPSNDKRHPKFSEASQLAHSNANFEEPFSDKDNKGKQGYSSLSAFIYLSRIKNSPTSSIDHFGEFFLIGVLFLPISHTPTID